MSGNAAQPQPGFWRTWVLLCLAYACPVLAFVNMGSITAATPDLSGTFVVGTLDISWSGAACPLGTTLSFGLAAYLWSRIGLRRALRLGLLLLCAGSLAGWAADHFLIMIAARFAQGMGGGLALVYSTGVLNAVLPPEKRGLPTGAKLCCIGLASCASPVVGCLLVQYWDWRGLFVLMAVFSGLMAVFASLHVPDQKIPKNGKFDWFSFLALGMGCVCIIMVLIYGETDGWTAPNVLAWMYGGVCSFALTVISCMTHKSSLLDFRVLVNWRVLCALLASLCNIFCVCWVRAGTVQYMRNVMNYDPSAIACVFVVLVVSFCVGAAFVLPLMHRNLLALRVGMMAGLLGLAGSAFFLSRLDAGCSWLDVAWPLVPFGVGYALCLNTATPLMLRSLPGHQVPAASRTLNIIRYVFVSLYISSVSTVLAHMKTEYHFTVAERTGEGSPGTVHTMDLWQSRFAEAGGTPGEIHDAVHAVLNQAVSLQSQIFSADYLYLCVTVIGAAGVLFALLCFRTRPEEHTAS